MDGVEFPDSCSSVGEDFACGQVGSRQPALCTRLGEYGENDIPYSCNVNFILPCDDDDDGCANEEICDDLDGEDEDCNGSSNCGDSACAGRAYCRTQCDKDDDKHFSDSKECGGDDCSDDPASDPDAARRFPGNTENTAALCSDKIDNNCDVISDCQDPTCQQAGQQGGFCQPTPEICDDDGLVDEDLDGFPNCNDSDCNEDPHCQIGGGGGGGEQTYTYYSCYGYYAVTTYYYFNGETYTYLYETWDYIGMACYAY